MPDHTYHGGGQVFRVEERDAVTALVGGKQKIIGYNHSRAWRAALDESRKAWGLPLVLP